MQSYIDDAAITQKNQADTANMGIPAEHTVMKTGEKEEIMKRITFLFVLCFTLTTVSVFAGETELSSIIEQAKELLASEDYDAAIQLFQEAASQGDPVAQNALGYCYEKGLGVEQSDEEALRYYQQALDIGYEPDEEDKVRLKEVLGEGYGPAQESSADHAFTEKSVTVIKDGEDAGELTLRFYDVTPNVPYIGMNEYSTYMKQMPLSIRENSDGSYTLANGIGEELLCDPDAGTITVTDWNGFFDLPLPLENEAKGWKDTATRFIRIADVEFEKAAVPVTLDFSKYAIRIYADENDIYLPVSTLSNIMTDIATNYMVYNGENLYALRISLDGSVQEGLYQSETLKAELEGQERPEDIAAQSYADLCLAIDYFYGHPGKAPLEETVAELGLDAALDSLGKRGEKLKAKLQSADLSEYLSAMYEVLMNELGDGHTLFSSGAAVLLENEGSVDTVFGIPRLSLDFTADLLKSPVYMKQVLHEQITIQRQSLWGYDTYRESGNTAIIRLDSFMPDEEAWDLYYRGEGDFPQDSLGIVISGLRRASENPEIENVIFDLSCNSGGSPDVMMAILEVTVGQTQLYGIHKLTDRKMTFTFEADTNFDGVYDEKDKEVNYDFNYGVLVTRHAFSCGNLFPIIAQEAGAVLIGEPSSGGSCCIQIGTDAEGFSYAMSSAQWKLTDSNGADVEGGCSVDIPIETIPDKKFDSLLGLLGVDEDLPDFEKYFDDAYLAQLMNDYFQDEQEVLPAA